VIESVAVISVLAGFIWAAAVSARQLRVARGEGRREYGRRAGDPVLGILYNFTHAMLPQNKESIRRHPLKFGVGLLMHLGVFLCLAAALLSLLRLEWGQIVLRLGAPLLLLSAAAGVTLLLRRTAAPDLRAMSAPDDYFSSLLSIGWTALAGLTGLLADRPIVFLFYTSLLLLYLPLGKLRHAVFFFAARWDLGRRLGYRGVYPPSALREKAEPGDG
jgi:hypothetical protein